MSWHAVDAVDDAVEATRRFLFPFRPVRWTVLALLVLLMGSTVSTNTSLPFLPDAELTLFPDGVVPTGSASGLDTGALVAIVGGFAAVGVVISVTALSLRLVFYDALRTNEVRVWTPFIARFRQAFGLFVFSTVVGLVTILPLLVALAASTTVGWGPADAIGDAVTALPGWGIGVALFFAVLLTVCMLLITRFTYEFVVPVMVHRDEGVLSAWKRFWVTLRESWTEFLLYLVVHFFLGVGVSVGETVVFLFAGGAVIVLGAVALLIVSGLLGGLSGLTGTTIGVVSVVLVVLIGLFVLLVVFLPVRLVTRTYLITYEVSMLGGVDARLRILDPSIDPNAPDHTPSEDPTDSIPPTE